MELNICYLYPELLNTYGDEGNVKILKYRASSRGITVNLYSHSLGAAFDKDLYDIVIIGGGQEKDIDIAGTDMEKIKEDLLRYIEEEKVLLAVCSGYQLLGEYYYNSAGEKKEGLKLLPVYTEKSDERFTGNVLVEINGERCVGFENNSGKTYIGSLSPLGKVIKGKGNNGEDGTEGVRYKNTFCTYLHGPFLSKNPATADEILSAALVKKYGEARLLPLDDEYEISAKKMMIKRMKK